MYLFICSWVTWVSSLQKYFQDQLLAQAVFKVFDKDGSGTMDFTEFMQARGGGGADISSVNIVSLCRLSAHFLSTQ